ncbi:MAG: pectin acetylesterase-family hydrolase [Myxococcota bacterium]
MNATSPSVVLSTLFAVGLIGCGDEAPASGTFRLGPAPTSNSCTDAGWIETLRCQALAADGLADPPQVNWGSVPSSENEVKAFTRVFLPADAGVRCLDGTIPAIYVDAAAKPSDKWLFTMQGGGSCRMAEGATPGVFDDGQDCVSEYEDPREVDEMGTSHLPPMKNFNAIHSPGTARNPVFADYNRVRIHKCSFDRFNGRATYEDVSGTYHGTPITFDAYQQGFRIIRDSMDMLLPGVTYTSWSYDEASGQVLEEQATLPALLDAEQILVVGHSGAAQGLMNNLDWIASGLADRGVTADVRGVIDANYRPSLEGEALHATDASGAPLDGGLYSGDLVGFSEASGSGTIAPFEFDAEARYTDPSGREVFSHTLWNVKLDESCLEAHAATGDTWICHDRYHVLHNHISTPMFVRQDLSDPGSSHSDSGQGFKADWAQWHTDPALCAWFGGAPCPPRLSLAEYDARLAAQATTFVDDYGSAWEGAAADPTIDYDSPPTLFLWMPDCGRHAGSYNAEAFFDTEIDTVDSTAHSMRTWLETFVSAPPSGVKNIRLDGRIGRYGLETSVCP